jgi:hypothetical protein
MCGQDQEGSVPGDAGRNTCIDVAQGVLLCAVSVVTAKH